MHEASTAERVRHIALALDCALERLQEACRALFNEQIGQLDQIRRVLDAGPAADGLAATAAVDQAQDLARVGREIIDDSLAAVAAVRTTVEALDLDLATESI